MARIELAPEVLDDLERFADHMAQVDTPNAAQRLDELFQALEILQKHPLIGRPVKGGKRELVIGDGAHAYLALYRFLRPINTVFVLALRHQREERFKR